MTDAYATGSCTIKPPSKGWVFVSGGAGALEASTKSLAVDLAPIRVNTIACGVVCPTSLSPRFSVLTKMLQVLTEVC